MRVIDPQILIGPFCFSEYCEQPHIELKEKMVRRGTKSQSNPWVSFRHHRPKATLFCPKCVVRENKGLAQGLNIK